MSSKSRVSSKTGTLADYYPIPSTRGLNSSKTDKNTASTSHESNKMRNSNLSPKSGASSLTSLQSEVSSSSTSLIEPSKSSRSVKRRSTSTKVQENSSTTSPKFNFSSSSHPSFPTTALHPCDKPVLEDESVPFSGIDSSLELESPFSSLSSISASKSTNIRQNDSIPVTRAINASISPKRAKVGAGQSKEKEGSSSNPIVIMSSPPPKRIAASSTKASKKASTASIMTNSTSTSNTTPFTIHSNSSSLSSSASPHSASPSTNESISSLSTKSTRISALSSPSTLAVSSLSLTCSPSFPPNASPRHLFFLSFRELDDGEEVESPSRDGRICTRSHLQGLLSLTSSYPMPDFSLSSPPIHPTTLLTSEQLVPHFLVQTVDPNKESFPPLSLFPQHGTSKPCSFSLSSLHHPLLGKSILKRSTSFKNQEHRTSPPSSLTSSSFSKKVSFGQVYIGYSSSVSSQVADSLVKEAAASQKSNQEILTSRLHSLHDILNDVLLPTPELLEHIQPLASPLFHSTNTTGSDLSTSSSISMQTLQASEEKPIPSASKRSSTTLRSTRVRKGAVITSIRQNFLAFNFASLSLDSMDDETASFIIHGQTHHTIIGGRKTEEGFLKVVEKAPAKTRWLMLYNLYYGNRGPYWTFASAVRALWLRNLHLQILTQSASCDTQAPNTLASKIKKASSLLSDKALTYEDAMKEAIGAIFDDSDPASCIILTTLKSYYHHNEEECNDNDVTGDNCGDNGGDKCKSNTSKSQSSSLSAPPSPSSLPPSPHASKSQSSSPPLGSPLSEVASIGAPSSSSRPDFTLASSSSVNEASTIANNTSTMDVDEQTPTLNGATASSSSTVSSPSIASLSSTAPSSSTTSSFASSIPPLPPKLIKKLSLSRPSGPSSLPQRSSSPYGPSSSIWNDPLFPIPICSSLCSAIILSLQRKCDLSKLSLTLDSSLFEYERRFNSLFTHFKLTGRCFSSHAFNAKRVIAALTIPTTIHDSTLSSKPLNQSPPLLNPPFTPNSNKSLNHPRSNKISPDNHHSKTPSKPENRGKRTHINITSSPSIDEELSPTLLLDGSTDPTQLITNSSLHTHLEPSTKKAKLNGSSHASQLDHGHTQHLSDPDGPSSDTITLIPTQTLQFDGDTKHQPRMAHFAVPSTPTQSLLFHDQPKAIQEDIKATLPLPADKMAIVGSEQNLASTASPESKLINKLVERVVLLCDRLMALLPALIAANLDLHWTSHFSLDSNDNVDSSSCISSADIQEIMNHLHSVSSHLQARKMDVFTTFVRHGFQSSLTTLYLPLSDENQANLAILQKLPPLIPFDIQNDDPNCLVLQALIRLLYSFEYFLRAGELSEKHIMQITSCSASLAKERLLHILHFDPSPQSPLFTSSSSQTQSKSSHNTKGTNKKRSNAK